jgi:hypothetical protein
MTVWNLLEWAAWLLSALVAAWLLYDAVTTSRRYSEEFLTHTVEDLGDFDDPGAEGARP